MPTDVHVEATDRLRLRLSRETREVHEALHSHPRLLPLADGSISQHQLIALLIDYRAIYTALETRRAARQWCLPVTLAAPIGSLEVDIDVLPGSLANERRFTGLPQTEAHCLGALYVMLGAQFGARVLGASLSRAIPGLRSVYFAPCPQTLAAWRDLLLLLKDVCPGSDEEAATVAGAHTMFERLGRFLSEAGDGPNKYPFDHSTEASNAVTKCQAGRHPRVSPAPASAGHPAR